jgi:hypothetical protein
MIRLARLRLVQASQRQDGAALEQAMDAVGSRRDSLSLGIRGVLGIAPARYPR